MEKLNKKTENALIKIMKQNILKTKEHEQQQHREEFHDITDSKIQRELKKINYLQKEYQRELEQEDFPEEGGDGQGLLDAVHMQERLDRMENEHALSVSSEESD